MKNKIEDLREHLFGTLADLRNPDKPLDLDRAKAVVTVAQVIVDSARVEVEMVRVTGGRGTGFIPEELPKPIEPNQPRLVKGTAHR